MTKSFSKYMIPVEILLVLMLLSCQSIGGSFMYCPCEKVGQCQRIPNGDNLKHEGKEIHVMSSDYTEPRKTWEHWNWELISSVISENEPDSTLMCYTHLQKRRYGYTGKLPKNLLEKNETESWIFIETHRAKGFFIDIYLLDILEVTSSGLTAEDVTEIINVISLLKARLVSISADISFMCLINWFPPCREHQCNFISKMLSVCDYFMLNSESFLSTEETHCLAQATVPFTKLRLGLDEYMAYGVPPEKFILSVPWHGYVYDCNIFKAKGNGSLYDQCFVKKENGSETCDYKHSRTRIDMNTLAKNYINFETNNTWNSVYLASYFNVKETTGEMKQIWFEEYRSLHHKYEYIKEMNVSGIALWSGNDLHYSSSKWFGGFNKVMWGWVAHQLFMKPEKPNINEYLKTLPQTMAAIGISCVLVGGILGFIFGWGVFRRTHKRNRRQPFDKDMLYMDEDQNL